MSAARREKLGVSRFHLPGGFIVTEDADEAAAEVPGIFADECRRLHVRVIGPSGDPVSLRDLPLEAFHTLRALSRRLGRVPEAPIPLSCENCGARTEVRPSSTLELGPFIDDELDDPELDEPFDFGRSYEIPGLGRVRLAPRTVRQAEPLFDALARAGPLRVTSRFVEGMGIVALDDVADVRRIARRIAHTTGQAFEELGALFESAHYPPRLEAEHRCTECGVALWSLAPAERELSTRPEDERRAPPPEVVGDSTLETLGGRSDTGASFMDVDAFEARVRRLAPGIYRALGIDQVDLTVVSGPADTDEGGHALLGSYMHADPDALIPAPAEVKLYYRTFANMYREEPYDVDAEIEETLRHELEHHLGYLAGDDPMDRDEREELARDAVRRAGARATTRRDVQAAARSVREFFRATWWVWLIAAAGAASYFVQK